MGTSPNAVTLTLLSRAYCHLCDEMLVAVKPLAEAGGATIVVVDVDANPWLERLYGDRVPVLFAGDPVTGQEICHSRLDPGQVSAALGAGAARQAEVASEAKIR